MRARRLAPQFARHSLQLLVVAFVVYAALGGTWRNYKLAHNQRRIVSLIEGDLWGRLYGLNEDVLSIAGDPFETSLGFLGFPWSSRLFGIDSIDPILALDQLVHTGIRAAPPALWIGLTIPVLLAVLFGRFFCSHLCPMRLLFDIGRRVRSGLLRIGVRLPELRSPHRLGGFVLAGGLLASIAASAGVWLFVLPYVSLSAGLFLAISAGTGSALLVSAAGWALFDALAAPGLFCHNLCPTGFVLEQLGRISFWRVRKTTREACPGSCALCSEACPYALTPATDIRAAACDNCGLCVVACPTERLARRLVVPLTAILACVVVAAPAAQAHHNKGIPHYGYFENYPQVPTEEYVAVDGRWEISATLFNFQGLERRDSDTPNDVKIYLALYDLDADAGYTGPIDVEIRRDGALVSRFERVHVDEEAVYSTRETFPATGDYELVADTADARIVLPIRVDLASDRVNWLWVAAAVVPVVVVFALALAAGDRRNRIRTARRLAAGASLALLVQAFPAEASDEPHSGSGTALSGMGEHHEHHAVASREERGLVMIMAGLPLPMFLGGVGGVIALSFAASEWMRPGAARARRINLIRNRRVYRMFRNRWFQVVPQLATAAALAFLIYAGLFGSRVSNLTPVAVWTFWWGGLIFAVLLLGSAWCFVCPWDGLANWTSRLRLAKRTEPLSLGLPFPRALEGVAPAIVLFALLVWLELGTSMVRDPRTTAYLGLAMAAMAIVSALLWDGKRFCAHFCPVGRICGAYANFSPVEIRARNPRTCQVCTTNDCLVGNENGYPCPVGLSLRTVSDSSDCTMCTECIKSCDKHNVALNLRPFAADLQVQQQPRLDLAWLIVALLALTLFHGFSMTGAFESFEPGRLSVLKWMELNLGTGSTANFSLAMAIFVAIPTGLYWACCEVSAAWAGSGVDARRVFAGYALSLLPIALFYHLAHNLMHLVMEGGAIVGLISDPLGRGADWFGTRGIHASAVVSHESMWVGQVALILIGHVIGIVVAHRIARSFYSDRRQALRSVIPFAVLTIAISVFGLWLMHLDMNMRIGQP